jgi:hypothetical protein
MSDVNNNMNPYNLPGNQGTSGVNRDGKSSGNTSGNTSSSNTQETPTIQTTPLSPDAIMSQMAMLASGNQTNIKGQASTAASLDQFNQLHSSVSSVISQEFPNLSPGAQATLASQVIQQHFM